MGGLMKTATPLMISALVLSFLVSAGNDALGDPDSVACPASIKTTQEPVKDHPGWTVFNRDSSSFLNGITIYEGNPQALRIPDFSDRQIEDHTQPDGPSERSELDIWTLTKGKEYWIKCSYLTTPIGLTRKLPPNITKCTAKYKGFNFVSESCE